MADELTITGLNIDDFETRRAAVVTEIRSTVSAILDCTPDQPTGQLIDILLERIQAHGELLQAIHAAMDPDQATGQSLDGVCSITGTYRDAATHGTVTLTVNLNAATTLPAGSIAAVAGDPDNQWVTTADVTSVGAGNYPAPAQASETGPIQALAGTITVIVTPVAGWNTVTNAADAAMGEDEETDTDFRLRREIEVTIGGSTSVDSIRAAVSQVDGIIECYCYENDRHYAVAPMPPNSIELVYWDGGMGAALPVEIAEVIFEEKAAGTQAYGTNIQTHIDTQGNTHEIGLTLADEQVVELEYTLVTDGDYPGNVAFRAAVAAWDDANLGIGDDVLHSRWVAVAFTVPGVVNVTLLRLRFFGGAWGTADLAVGTREIATVDSADITVI